MPPLSAIAHRTLSRVRTWLSRDIGKHIHSSLMLSAKVLSDLNASRGPVASLVDFEFKVFSQFGEDGIVAWLVQCLDPTRRIFVEFGVEDYSEANTRYLLESRNWRGLVIDASKDHMERLRSSPLQWKFDISCVSDFVRAENINDILQRSGCTGGIGLLSIDIDGNDFWVWKAISAADPDIVVCEYNARLGDRLPLSIPYDPNFRRSAAHYSNMYFGASIAALEHLAEDKGYTLIGTNSAGNNAFFIRKSLVWKIQRQLTAVQIWPANFREERNRHGELTLTFRHQISDVAPQLPLVNVVTGESRPATDWGNLLSSAWEERCPRVLRTL